MLLVKGLQGFSMSKDVFRGRKIMLGENDASFGGWNVVESAREAEDGFGRNVCRAWGGGGVRAIEVFGAKK